MHAKHGLKGELNVENELIQTIRLKLFELRHKSRHQYVDEYEQGVLTGKEEVYEEWLRVLTHGPSIESKKEMEI